MKTNATKHTKSPSLTGTSKRSAAGGEANWLGWVFLLLILTSCYHDKTKQHDAFADEQQATQWVSSTAEVDSVALQRQQDSLSFNSNHHYTNNYNFVVKRDSLPLIVQQPEEMLSGFETDTVMLYRSEPVVVAEIRIMPNDTVDSVWVRLARDQYTFGWIHETEMLPAVVPDDPISEFIDLFSDSHIIWTLLILIVFGVIYVMRHLKRHNAKIVHFNDINSFYPSALVLAVSFAATFYAAIQTFEPEMWRHYYYHPTLNPFSLPPLLAAFFIVVWLIPILGVASIDDVRKHLPYDDALMYLVGLAAVCMVDYIIFSVFTLYYIGYPLLGAYIYFSVRTFKNNRQLVYYCGGCGRAIHEKGMCPYCGAMNV